MSSNLPTFAEGDVYTTRRGTCTVLAHADTLVVRHQEDGRVAAHRRAVVERILRNIWAERARAKTPEATLDDHSRAQFARLRWLAAEVVDVPRNKRTDAQRTIVADLEATGLAFSRWLRGRDAPPVAA